MAEDTPTKFSSKRIWALWSILILALIIAFFFYWRHEKYYPNTDDAYVQANIVNIAAQISGPIIKVNVQNHQQVKKGELLVEIDPASYQYTLNKAQAEYKNAYQAVQASADAVTSAEALVTEREARLVNTEKNYERVHALFLKKLVSFAEDDQASSDFEIAKATLKAAKSQLAQAQAELGAQGEANAKLQIAKANLDQAQLNLQHTRIIAPVNGYIANFKLRVGSMITAQQPLFALIDNSHWWVSANYKETELDRIKVGQPATIKVDMYPEHKFKGIVISLGRGSGAAFSLLPPENATGNWVKVTQRFPVRVKIINPDPQFPLRVGASSTITIDTLKTNKPNFNS